MARSGDLNHFDDGVVEMQANEVLSQSSQSSLDEAQTQRHLARLFEASADRFASRVALRHGSRAWTYRQLDARASGIARELAARGVGRGAFVGLCMERSMELIASLLGILKAGAAYVPIDPTYPAKRIGLILRDAGPSIVLSTEETNLPQLDPSFHRIDVDACEDAQGVSVELKVTIDPCDPAYVIYTSGSTGSPKGVVVAHRNVARLFTQTQPWFKFSEHDVWTLFHSIGFDFSVWEIWGALLYGGSLVLVPTEITRSPDAFRHLLDEYGVTVLNQTPTAFRNLIRAEQRRTRHDIKLRYIILGGERLSTQWLRPWYDLYPDSAPRIHNMFGTTETTVHATCASLSRQDAMRLDASPIGIPIPDLTIHIVDEHMKPVQAGVAGEMCIEGDGVSLGYLNKPELTEQRFKRAVREGVETRLYRTGDLARREADGTLSYLGRSDEQMKVRGFRIEPQEIELCLGRHPAVGTAVVQTHDFGQGDVRLLAYVIARSDHEASSDTRALERSLMKLAAEELPAHMCPSAYLFIESLPLTAHGKIDRSKLPAPMFAAEAPKPAGADGSSILGIWERVLKRGGIQEEDDFFDIGGTSLALLRLLAEVEAHCGVRIDPAALVEGITVARMDALVAGQGRA